MIIGFIGAGRMASALARGIATAQAQPRNEAVQFVISDPSADARARFENGVGNAKVVVAERNADVIAQSDVVFLAVKPQQFDVVMTEIDCRETDVLLVSIAAGIRISKIESTAGTSRIVRVMPNTPCLIGKGASGLAAASGATGADIELVDRLLAPVSTIHRVSESQMDAVTGLSGSGPAFVFTFIESLADAGIANGLPAETALQLALQTVAGAAELAIQSDLDLSELRNSVTSPGGTTLAGLESMKETGFRQSVLNAVSSATKRSVELGRES